jgi:hypothetical protein
MPGQTILVPRDDRVDLAGVSRCEESLKSLALNLPEGGFVLIHELTHDLGRPAAEFTSATRLAISTRNGGMSCP